MMQRLRFARRLEPVVQKDQRILEYGEWKRAPELRVDRRRNLRVWPAGLRRIQVLAPVEAVAPMPGVRNLGHHRVSDLTLTAEIPVMQEGVLEPNLERVRSGCKRSDRRIIQQIADESLRRRQPELERGERLLVFANPWQILDGVLIITDWRGVEEQAVAGSDDRAVVDAIRRADARPEVELLGLRHRPGHVAAGDHDPRQLVHVQIVEREREIE